MIQQAHFHRLLGSFLVALLFSLSATPARAQSQVSVNEDQTIIWRPGFSVIAEIVAAGTVLDVVTKTGTWYEIVVRDKAGRRQTGFVAVSRVTALDQKPLRTPERQVPARSTSGSTTQRNKPQRVAMRFFVQGGYGLFTANDTFDAVLGSRGGGWFGGGFQVRMPSGLFAEVAADRFQKVGTRVFVFNGEVFDLGIEDKVRIIPVTGSVGYRFMPDARGRLVPYVSAGAGLLLFREASAGANEQENVDETFGVYQAIAGLEVPAGRVVAVAFEAQYSTAPGAIDAGTGLLFGESDLGGVQFRVKLLFGR